MATMTERQAVEDLIEVTHFLAGRLPMTSDIRRALDNMADEWQLLVEQMPSDGPDDDPVGGFTASEAFLGAARDLTWRMSSVGDDEPRCAFVAEILGKVADNLRQCGWHLMDGAS